jgi:putative transposase
MPSYWRLFYHLVWATKERTPLITAEIEAPLFRIITERSNRLHAPILAVNGMPDHIHVIASVPPTIALSEYVRQLKGASSRLIGMDFNTYFAWQTGYSVFSVSERNLPLAVAYVEQQKEHHRDGTAVARMEKIVEDRHSPPGV